MPESVTDRPTTAHEYIYLLSRSADYFYDADAIREPHLEPERVQAEIERQHRKRLNTAGLKVGDSLVNHSAKWAGDKAIANEGRNKRTVWTVPTAPYPGAHFATFPPKLIEPCILAGTSARGCCAECGAPWERVVERDSVVEVARGAVPSSNRANLHGPREAGITTRTTTLGWQPTCKHHDAPLVPCTVLDPFAGSGTTLSVALRHGRRAVGVELSPEYIRLAEKRVAETQPALFALEEAI